MKLMPIGRPQELLPATDCGAHEGRPGLAVDWILSYPANNETRQLRRPRLSAAAGRGALSDRRGIGGKCARLSALHQGRRCRSTPGARQHRACVCGAGAAWLPSAGSGHGRAVRRCHDAGGMGRDKGMQVLQFWSDLHRETPVDMFVHEPFDFEDEYRRSLAKPLGRIAVRFVTIPTLIRMKEAADRPQDRIDIEYLKRRLEDGAAS